MSKSNNKKTSRLFVTICVVIFLTILAPLSFIGWRLTKGQTQIRPFPYHFASYTPKNLSLAQEATVLIVGDSLARNLENYQTLLAQKASIRLNGNLNIYNWGEDNENLPRTIEKLKALKKIPPVVVYQGGSQEFFEKRFYKEDISKIISNFKISENEKYLSAIMAFPILSRILYAPIHRYEYKEEITQDKDEYSGVARQRQSELLFKIFELEIEEMINWAKEKKTKIIFVSTPLNFEVPPHLDCSNTTTENLKVYQEELSEKIKNGELKETQNELLSLTQKIIGNATNWYLLGTVYLKTGENLKAKDAFKKAIAYDCEPWRGNPIFNIIIYKKSNEFQMPFVDFEEMINRKLGLDATFLTDLYPQAPHYEEFVEKLSQKVMEILKI